ncbi:arylsulfotransferase family protein [Mucilaginibacter sp. X4EP1]|uniref:arylsulfotransferase family protein n=1 Tax=Mucilaginibacter sp. X4EP1 TaxID=2723092 RepID=UPI0021697596|nr:arylsulfotransferase family protein [Mucilaginibacter sp. X4EP1]MCS3814118.1 hypothetical protein [Mucilaginibacter sp. X4EP1]
MKKALRYFKISYVVLIALMLTAWLVRYSVLQENGINPKIEKAIVSFAAFPTTIHSFFRSGAIRDVRYVDDATTPAGLHYFVDTAQIPKGYLLISTFKENKELEIRLLDLRKNIVVKKWTLNPDTIMQYAPHLALNRFTIRLFHPLFLKDSSLICNANYFLFKINKDSKIVWVNKNEFHHSIQYASDTAVWACETAINQHTSYWLGPKDTLLNTDISLVNSNTGKVVFEKSIYDILNQNGYAYLLAVGAFENDDFHLNEICPALTDGKYWKKGDLLISLRQKSAVFLYRPSTNKILWLQMGPWANQHSCSFSDDENIMILGNDIVRNEKHMNFLHQHNNIYTYNFKNNTTDTPYSKMMGILKPQTYTEGRCGVLPNGDVLFDETDRGKVYIFDHDKLKLTYCDRIDSKHIKILNWVRYVPN